MDEEIQRKYLEALKELKAKEEEAYDKIIKWAEKFGRLGEATKNHLEKITEKLDKPYHKTGQFYTACIVAVAIILSTLIAVYTKTCIIVSFGDVGLKMNCEQNEK